jgi:hypothetical protein
VCSSDLPKTPKPLNVALFIYLNKIIYYGRFGASEMGGGIHRRYDMPIAICQGPVRNANVVCISKNLYLLHKNWLLPKAQAV